ncbi:unnamed protein product [Tilletia laevis]|nr:unnamed protein product [Tilletia caries]CAD6948606.1 unnamed protein product [Tilletia laevis]CAD6964858.1 unnamed protein product [Tilletia controversa]CAD7065744.1 unnamed protein product [Tilletia caries]
MAALVRSFSEWHALVKETIDLGVEDMPHQSQANIERIRELMPQTRAAMQRTMENLGAVNAERQAAGLAPIDLSHYIRP